MTLFYHEATPVGLNNLLLTEPYFAKNWRIIPKLVRLLNRILRWNHQDEQKGGQSDITWRVFYNQFRSDYPKVIHGLESLELLNVVRSGRGEKGLKCYAYRLTEKCHIYLSDDSREYLHKIITDKASRRRVQKRIAKREYGKKVYGDVRDEIKATVDGIQFDEAEVNRLCDCYPDEKAAFVRSVLIQIEEKNYEDLNHNEEDNRIPNPYTQLPAQVKSLVRIDGLPYVTTFDIRSAYPSMWAHYLQWLHPENTEIHDEKQAYERIFLDPKCHPRDYLARLLGIDEREMKTVMLEYFNGQVFQKSQNNPFFRFDSWLAANFPKMYALWKKTDIKQTGNQLGKHFETKLMLDGSIFRKARSLGLAIGYENDGFSVFGKVDAEHPSIRELLDFVSEKSVQLLGIRLVIVSKPTPKWKPFDIIKTSHEERADTLCKNWAAFCRRYFRIPPQERNWNEFEAREKDLIAGLQKCATVLERLQAGDSMNFKSI